MISKASFMTKKSQLQSSIISLTVDSQIFSKNGVEEKAWQCGLNKVSTGFLYLYSRLSPRKKEKETPQGTMWWSQQEEETKVSLWKTKRVVT